MKDGIRRVNRGGWLALLLCAVLLLGVWPSQGAMAARRKNSQTGTLTIKLSSDILRQLESGVVIEFTLYRIGEAAPQSKAGWKLYDDFSELGIIEAKTSEELGIAANKAAGVVAARQYKGVTLRLSSAGEETFGDLPQGVYLGVLTRGVDGLRATPFIVTMPSVNPETKEPQYSYSVGIKATYQQRYEPAAPLTEVTVTKDWDDDDDSKGQRPQEITIKLLADGAVYREQKLTAIGGWKYTFSGLPKYRGDGGEIVYTVDEVEVENYDAFIDGTSITNKLIERKPKAFTEITGTKTWVDNDNAAGKRPGSITVQLLRDDEVYRTLVVTAATNWRYTFANLPVDDGYDHEYDYTIREIGVDDYFCVVDDYDLINKRLGGDDEEGKPKKRGRLAETRRTGTPPPPFENLTEEEFEELIDLFGYGVPLWGMLMGTGDETPAWPWIFAGIGAVALLMIPIIGRRKRRRGAGH